MFRFSPGRCCCGDEGCRFFQDDFTRADNDDPGNYIEESGDWDVSSNQLANLSTGTLISPVEHPTGEPNIRVQVTVVIPAGAARIVLDYVDSDNYWYAEAAVGGTGTGGVSIVQVSGGSPTTMASVLPEGGLSSDTPINFCASIEDGIIIASAGLTAVASGTFSSPVWGLAAINSGSHILFDSVDVSKTHTTDCRGCNYPCAFCQDGTWPTQFKVVLPEGMFGYYNSDGLDGCTEENCPLGEGTYYLPRTTCLEYNDIGLHTHVGSCMAADRDHDHDSLIGCAYAKCSLVECESSGFAVMASLYCIITETAVTLYIDNKSTTLNGTECTGGLPLYQALYQHEFTEVQPVNCRWTDLELDFLQLWDGDTVYDAPPGPPSTGGTYQRCLPLTTAIPVLTAIP